VRTLGGITFINDSKATNAQATAPALACYEDIYWIVGGRPKEGGLAGLEPYAKKIRQAFLIGESEAAFAAWMEKNGVPGGRCGTLEHAVTQAYNKARAAGRGAVLLSPACASFDQFRNFEHRGEVFTDLVNALEESA
jgi:UDP-N-acetylmuramoylalanine--D-glutamate ligase